jgi:acyl-CoA synthetase (AMP-forming)/AMP-acid ligase II
MEKRKTQEEPVPIKNQASQSGHAPPGSTHASTWLTDRLRGYPDAPAILRGKTSGLYRDVVEAVGAWGRRLAADGVAPGQAVLFDADIDVESIALLIALLDRDGIAIPLTPNAVVRPDVAREIARPHWRYTRSAAHGAATTTADVVAPPRGAVIAGDHAPPAAHGAATTNRWTTHAFPDATPHTLYDHCRGAGQGGLVIFTSGSTGTPKASLHRADRFLSKFEKPHPALRTLLVLPLDHMAGLDSLFYALTSGGAVVVPETSDPAGICRAIAEHQAELLSATPSLLNLLWLSGCLARHDLSSLKIITYGAEVMPDVTLQRLRDALPNCRFIQKYGATEFGSPPTRSREDGSLWFKISPGTSFETRVIDGILWVRSPSAMLGYLNAPSPIDAEGWINTGDRVEVDGDYFRVLGRQSELINVGGQKVNPVEVENVLLAAGNIRDAVVMGEKNPILGNTVAAVVRLVDPEDLPAMRARLRMHCRDRLPREAIPVRIEIADDQTWNSRYKKTRNQTT